MKNSLLVLFAILVAGTAGFFFSRTHHGAEAHDTLLDSLPELVWVKENLDLTDDQFAKVRELHVAYRPRCESLCHELMGAREKVEALAKQGDTLSTELEDALRDHALVKARCQQAMLEHLYQTAGVLTQDQARRFLDIMLPYALDPANPGSQSVVR
jgi:hypothetical protein